MEPMLKEKASKLASMVCDDLGDASFYHANLEILKALLAHPELFDSICLSPNEISEKFLSKLSTFDPMYKEFLKNDDPLWVSALESIINPINDDNRDNWILEFHRYLFNLPDFPENFLSKYFKSALADKKTKPGLMPFIRKSLLETVEEKKANLSDVRLLLEGKLKKFHSFYTRMAFQVPGFLQILKGKIRNDEERIFDWLNEFEKFGSVSLFGLPEKLIFYDAPHPDSIAEDPKLLTRHIFEKKLNIYKIAFGEDEELREGVDCLKDATSEDSYVSKLKFFFTPQSLSEFANSCREFKPNNIRDSFIEYFKEHFVTPDPSVFETPTQGAIDWEEGEIENEEISELPFQQGWLKVPMAHDQPELGTINLRIRRHTKGELLNNAIHVIHIEGGPGSDTVFKPEHYKSGDFIAHYTFDHRGVMESRNGLTLEPNDAPNSLKPQFTTVRESAKDLAQIVQALKVQFPRCRVVLYGLSYGSLLTNHFVELSPKHVEAAIMDGMPPIYGFSKMPSFSEYVRDCELSKFCRKKLGTDIYELFDRLISTMDRESNECIVSFFKNKYEDKKNYTEKLAQLALDLAYESNEIESQLGINPGQIILPLIKALNDCEPAKLSILTESLGPIMEITESGGEESEDAVFDLIHMDLKLSGAKFQDKEYGITSFDELSFDYRKYIPNDLLKNISTQMSLSQPQPAQTPYTEMYFLSCRRDLTTPPGSSYDVMNKVKAPKKEFMTLHDCAHCSASSICKDLMVYKAYFGFSFGDIEGCLDHEGVPNDRMNLDWEFSEQADIAEIWEAVKPTQPHNRKSRVPAVPRYTII